MYFFVTFFIIDFSGFTVYNVSVKLRHRQDLPHPRSLGVTSKIRSKGFYINNKKCTQLIVVAAAILITASESAAFEFTVFGLDE